MVGDSPWKGGGPSWGWWLTIYGKLASGAESHYEICYSFPQNARTLHTLESSIFIEFCVHQILTLLPLQAKMWEQKVSQKVKILILLFWIIQDEKTKEQGGRKI